MVTRSVLETVPTVTAHIHGGPLRRTVSTASYLSQSSHVLHFGLGPLTQVDQLDVAWLGGQTSSFTNLEANATWEVTEDDPVPRRLPDRAARRAQNAGPEQLTPSHNLPRPRRRQTRKRTKHGWSSSGQRSAPP